MKTTRKLKTVYRFGDLGSGENFRIDSYPYDTLTVADSFCGGWLGNSRIALSENCPVDPVNRRRAAANRLVRVNEICKRFKITRRELQEVYRSAVSRKPYLDPLGHKNTAVVESIPEPFREALGWFGLGLIVGYGNSQGENCYMLVGSPSKLYL